MPVRIQQKRSKGWRKPENTVGVSRHGRFGNPWRVKFDPAILMWEVLSEAGAVAGIFESKIDAHKTAVEQFALGLPDTELRAARTLLGGRNLMCFCPEPPPGVEDADWCHAGWLLAAVNAPLKCEAA